MARMPNNVTIGLYTTGTCKVAYELAGRSARRFAIKWLAAPRAGPRAGEGRSHRRLRRAVSCPEKDDAIGRVARCMDLHGFHGLHGALVYLSPPAPPFCANQKYPCKGRHRHIRQSANLGT